VERSTEVEDAYRQYIGAIAGGDSAALAGLIGSGPDVQLVGADPAEWWTGHDAAVEAFRVQMQEMGGGFPIKPGSPQGYASGDVGWLADRPTLTLPDGETEFRITTVFHRADGQWRVVQSHASIGVANEEALGQELTI
jgi:ketosteroid isomerase-like protein